MILNICDEKTLKNKHFLNLIHFLINLSIKKYKNNLYLIPSETGKSSSFRELNSIKYGQTKVLILKQNLIIIQIS